MARTLLLALVLACNPLPDADGFPDLEGDEGGLIASEREVCQRLDFCDLWTGVDSCVDELLTTETCLSPNGYLGCMPECLDDRECSSFQACEADCWTRECEGEIPLDPL